MPKNFFNHHKKSRSIFQPNLHKIKHLSQIGKPPKIFRQTFKSNKDVNNDGKVSKREETGATIRQVGQMATIVGSLTGQEELTLLGTGLEVTGEIVSGGSAKDVAIRIGADIVGTAVGQATGGLGGGQIAQIVAGNIATNLTQKVAGRVFDSFGKSDGDRSQNDQLREQLTENQHIDDKESHHNSVQLPSDLQGLGAVKQDVGLTLERNPTDIVQKVDEFEEDIDSFRTGAQVLEFLVSNFDNLEHLTEKEQGEIFQEALNSGLVDNLLNELVGVF